MRHEFVHYNNTNQDQQSDEQRCCPKLVLGCSKSPSRLDIICHIHLRCWKIAEKVSSQMASKASYVQIDGKWDIGELSDFYAITWCANKKGSLFTNWLQMQMKSNFFCGKEMMAQPPHFSFVPNTLLTTNYSLSLLLLLFHSNQLAAMNLLKPLSMCVLWSNLSPSLCMQTCLLMLQFWWC